MDKKLLGKRINTARKERGWTSERLSEACNINATYLRQIESGAKVPSLQVFVLLCEALKVSPTYLLAEVLPSMELQNMDVLLELWQTATPKQITMMTSMIRSVFDFQLQHSISSRRLKNVVPFIFIVYRIPPRFAMYFSVEKSQLSEK